MAQILHSYAEIAMKVDRPSLLSEQKKPNRHDYSRQKCYLVYECILLSLELWYLQIYYKWQNMMLNHV